MLLTFELPQNICELSVLVLWFVEVTLNVEPPFLGSRWVP